MAFPYTEKQSVAVDKILAEIMEQKFQIRPAIELMVKKHGVKTSWGPFLRTPIASDNSGNAQLYQGYEVLSFTPKVNIRAAQYSWYNRADSFSISGDDWRETSGPEGKLDLVEEKGKIMRNSLMDQLDTDFWSNNDGTNRQPLGVQKVMAASTAIGGIAQADAANWDANRDTTTGAPTLVRINNLIRKCLIRNAKAEDMVGITRASVLTKIEANLLGTNVLRVADKKNIAWGFSDVSVLGIPLLMDDHVPGSDGGTSDNYLSFFNLDAYKYYVHPDQNFLILDCTKAAYQQDVILRQVRVTNQFVVNSRWTQATFTAIDPA